MALPNIINEINTIKSTYFPLTSKKIVFTNTAATEIFKDVATSAIGIRGGTTMKDGGWLALRGDQNSSNPGTFELKANSSVDGTSASLLGLPNGTLTWCENNVVTNGCTLSKPFKTTHPYFCGRDVDNDRLVIFGGTGNSDGSYIRLSGKNESSARAEIRTIGTDSAKSLVMYPNGDFKWDGKAVDCVHSSGINYIRYTSGIAICWGSLSGTASTATITFPITFANANYRAFATDTGGAKCATAIGSRTTTNCTLYCYNAGNTWGVDWLAIGVWK